MKSDEENECKEETKGDTTRTAVVETVIEVRDQFKEADTPEICQQESQSSKHDACSDMSI